MRSSAKYTRPLNVLVATPGGGEGQGGIDRMMASLKRELGRQAPAGLQVRFLATRGTGSIVLSALHLLRFCAAMAMARIQGRLDLVHINLASHGSTYRKLVIAACARLLGLPYVLHLHGAEYQSFWSADDTALNRRIRAMFQSAGRVLVLGSPWKTFIAERVPEAKARIVILPNATEAPSLPHVGGGQTVHIIFLGRIEERKGVPQLVCAFESMRKLAGWRATIAGDGDVSGLRRVLAESGLAGRVAVPGWLGPDDVARLIADGDILTLPSFAENLPISVIEAMAAGLGIVATPVGAVEDIIADGRTGLLVPPGDHDGLAAALTRLVEDGDLRMRLGEAARNFHRERLGIAPYAEHLCRVWADAAADAREMRRTPAEISVISK